MVSTTAPRRSKAQNQAVRAANLAFVLHKSGVTASDFRHGKVSDDQIALAEGIARFKDRASAETLGMVADQLQFMDEINTAADQVPADNTPITCEGNFGYVGAANEDTNSLTPIKTSVFGNHDGRKVTMRVRLSQDGALELAGRLLSVTRKVDAEKRAIAAREEMRG